MAFGMYVFLTVLLITAVGTVAVLGCRLLPETVRVRTAMRDPGTLTDLRWMATYYGYGALLFLAHRVAEAVPEGAAGGAGGAAERDAGRRDRRPRRQLRRIERDLHDGAQARLVALSLRIGLAKRAYDRDPDAARKLLDDAQEQTEQALVELRQVVRGIHPPILTDRGLVGAVRALAAGWGSPCSSEADLRVTVDVEGLEEDGPRAPAAVRRRVDALDGAVRMSSPVGGPTVIEWSCRACGEAGLCSPSGMTSPLAPTAFRVPANVGRRTTTCRAVPWRLYPTAPEPEEPPS